MMYMGAGKDIALGFEGNKDDVLVITGDNILDFSLTSFIEFFKREQASSQVQQEYRGITDQ